MVKVGIWLLLLGIFTCCGTFADSKEKVSLNHAAALYHQGRYDSSLRQLEALQSIDHGKRRDSISTVQYLGMASAKLGRDSAAIRYFSALLQFDSLFQFPKNEDVRILNAFQKAQDLRINRQGPQLTHELPPEPLAILSTPSPAPAPPAFPPPAIKPERETKNRSEVFIDRPRDTGKVGLAYGTWPLGLGWVAKRKTKMGLGLGALQASGLILSIYASQVQSREQGDDFGVKDQRELSSIKKWQWTQRIALSTGLGAYIFSIIAAMGD